MVNLSFWKFALLADQRGQTLLERLEPARAAKVLAALAALVILGFAMVALTWLGARVTRRYMNQGDVSTTTAPPRDDWAGKALQDAEHDDD